jgi:hypothetical protein
MFFLFEFFSRKWVKIAEMPALATYIMKNPSAPKVLTERCPPGRGAHKEVTVLLKTPVR